MSRAAFWYHPVYTEGLSPEARFPRDRYVKVRSELARRGVDRRAELRDSPLAEREDLLTVHDPDYVDRFLSGRLDEAMARRIGLRPWTARIQERTLRIIGGTVAATQAVLGEGYSVAGNLAGGTHHAFADAGAGYCVFNDLAVAAAVARRDFGVRRVLVLDLDVHQGDGTAAIFEREPEVFTFSIHGERNFPFRKRRSDLDVALPDGTTDTTYLDALDTHLPKALEQARPELVLLQAGVDPLAEDALGRMALTRAGLAERNRRVLERTRGLPRVVTMGGGYARPIERTVEALGDLFEAAAEAAQVPVPQPTRL